MRQDIDLASEGAIRTLECLENSPPPNNPFDYAVTPSPEVHAPVVARAFTHDNTYWQLGGPSIG